MSTPTIAPPHPKDQESGEPTIDISKGIGIGELTKKFKKALADHEQECNKTKNPFCRRCAWVQFEKNHDSYKRDIREGVKKPLASVLPNLKSYTGKYMTPEGESIAHNKKWINGNLTKEAITYKNYSCPIKHKMSIQE